MFPSRLSFSLLMGDIMSDAEQFAAGIEDNNEHRAFAQISEYRFESL